MDVREVRRDGSSNPLASPHLDDLPVLLPLALHLVKRLAKKCLKKKTITKDKTWVQEANSHLYGQTLGSRDPAPLLRHGEKARNSTDETAAPQSPTPAAPQLPVKPRSDTVESGRVGTRRHFTQNDERLRWRIRSFDHCHFSE